MARFALRPLAAFGIMGVAALCMGADDAKLEPSANEERIARTVVFLLERQHIAKPKIDDEIAKKWCKEFLKELDPRKQTFLKADVEGFNKQATELDDKIHEGNLDFAVEVFKTYLKRTDERFAAIQEILKEKHDFSADENIVDDSDLFDYPATAEEARDRVRKQIKLELLQAKMDKEKPEEATKKVLIRYRDRNRFFHQFDMADLLEVYLGSLTRTFDPHSTYMNSKTVEDTIQQALHLSLSGIGASLQTEDGFAIVKELVPNGPADKDGRLQPEDKILGIKKDDGTEVDFVQKKLSDIVRQIRGEAGTKVRLIVQSAESKEKKEIEITRAKVELKDQHAKGQIIEAKAGGKTLKVGVINLPAFYGDTGAILRGEADAVSATEDCRKLINEFKEKGIDLVMMDLRGNGGGLLNEAISLSGLFIETGPVVQVRDANGVKPHEDEDQGITWTGPLVVLIDRQSASASEIFAGVIKDYARGLIVGDSSTFGKGTVQSIVPLNDLIRQRNLPNLGALKLTIQQFYRANGESTQVQGVVPDIHIPSIFDHKDFGEVSRDNALKFDKVPAQKHDDFHKVTPELVAQLSKLSADRRKADPKFQKRDADIKRFNERKERHQISLNEDKYKAETVADANDDEDKAKSAKEKRKSRYDRPAWDANFYNDEILRIVGDYMTLGSKVVASTPVRADGVNN